MLYFTFLLFLYADPIPVCTFEVPFSDRLQNILSNTIFKNYTFDTGNIFGYLRGDNVSARQDEDPESLRQLGEDLEINTLDTDLLHKILRVAWRQEVDNFQADGNATRPMTHVTRSLSNVTRSLGNVTQSLGYVTRPVRGKGRRFRGNEEPNGSGNNTGGARRWYYYPHVNQDYYLKEKDHLKEPDVRETLMNLMKQSIYDVRYRMQRTELYRDRVDGSFDYRIGVLCGAISEKIIKLQSLFETVRHFNINRAKMIYYLIAYERYLAIYIDIITTSETVYLFHTQWREKIIAMDAGYQEAQHEKELQNQTSSTANNGEAGNSTDQTTGAPFF